MNKASANKNIVDLSGRCKSAFTLTFAIEILGLDIWHDCNEGWLDLGQPIQGQKLQYQLYLGQSYDIDVLIWPHVAKVFSGTHSCWVRTWQFLERRWIAFSIQHAFPVNVLEIREHVATVVPTIGMHALNSNVKNDKNIEVFLPPLSFGQRRYFAQAVDTEDSLEKFIQNLIWIPIKNYIPSSHFDGPFDVPYPVADVRHQDAVIQKVQDVTLYQSFLQNTIEQVDPEEAVKQKDRRESKIVKEKEKKKVPDQPKQKYEIKLSGNEILAGTGRIVSFSTAGDQPIDQGQIIALLSSNNLPAQDDIPVIFVNIDHLHNIPLGELKNSRISHIYTKWKLGDETHCSQSWSLKSKNPVCFDDHYAVPLQHSTALETMAAFLESPFEIQVRGIKHSPITINNPKLFGREKFDLEFGRSTPSKTVDEEQDVTIAVTKIDAKPLSKPVNGIIREDYSLFPQRSSAADVDRENICTNDINFIKAASIMIDPAIQPSVILKSQMTLEVTIGLVGCIPQNLQLRYSRLYCLIEDSEIIVKLLQQITKINESVLLSTNKDDSLTGYCIDTGHLLFLCVEGQRDGPILKVWETINYCYDQVKSYYSSSDEYASRLYPEMLSSAVPFLVLKMFVPLGVLLACPPLYVRPALPLPARSAALKIGRLVAGKLRISPCCSDLPTGLELQSFRLELCAPPIPLSNLEKDALKIGEKDLAG